MFSSSTEFEPERSYTKFAAYAMLNHGGDFRAAAQALRGQGLGAPMEGSVNGKLDAATEAPPPRNSCPAPLGPAAYIGLFGEIVTTIGPQTEADPAALLLQAMTLFGSVIGRTAHFRAEADRHYCNLFTAIVGPTSIGRKGVSLGHPRRLHEQADPDWARDCIASGLNSGEGLIFLVHDEIKKQSAIKEKGRVVDYEWVVEDPGIPDKRAMIIETELAGALKVMGREGNTLSPILRNAWDGRTLRSLTKNSPMRATDPHISIIGQITPQELRRHLDATEAANGFGNRYIWACVTRSKELPEGGGAFAVGPLLAGLRRAIEHAKGVGEMQRDDHARQLWGEVYGSLSAGRPGLAGDLTARAPAQVMRLACLFALGDLSAVVGLPHLRAALEVWRYAEQSVRYIFGSSLGYPEADLILRALEEAGPSGLTRDKIRNLFARHKTAQQIDQALALLKQYRLARRERDDSTGGRPAEHWVVETVLECAISAKSAESPEGEGTDSAYSAYRAGQSGENSSASDPERDTGESGWGRVA